MTLLNTYLHKFVGNNIIVVMVDGSAFFGTLKEYDEHFILLENVKETDYKKTLMWEEPKIRIPLHMLNPEKEKMSQLRDFIDERPVGKKLKTVLINISHVLRIWGETIGMNEEK